MVPGRGPKQGPQPGPGKSIYLLQRSRGRGGFGVGFEVASRWLRGSHFRGAVPQGRHTSRASYYLFNLQYYYYYYYYIVLLLLLLLSSTTK